MRNLLSCLALAMIVGIIGCGEPAAPPATPPADSGNSEGSTSSTATGEMTSVSLNVPGMT